MGLSAEGRLKNVACMLGMCDWGMIIVPVCVCFLDNIAKPQNRLKIKVNAEYEIFIILI